MSNAFILSNSNLPPAVPTEFICNTGSATVVANQINIIGSDGITTSGSGDTITIDFSSSTLSGTGQTIGAVTADIITVTPINAKGFSAQGLVVGYDSANNETVGGEIIAIGKKSAGVTSIVGTPDTTIDQDSGLGAAIVQVVANGADFILRVTGVAGRTIDWSAVINYVISP